MHTWCSGLVLLLVACGCVQAEETGAPRIKSADFPTVSKRCNYFEESINATNPEIRLRVLTEIGYFFHAPEPEYVAFLKRMMKDPAPEIRGEAIRKLYGMWVPIAVKELPTKFTGYHQGQLIDLENPQTIPNLLATCGNKAVSAGYAAYVLDLLREPKAVPALKKLADDPNIFVRYTTGRALISCGDRKSGREILEAIIKSQLALYNAIAQNNPPPAQEQRHAFYAIVACRSLMELGPQEHRTGLEQLITLWSCMENSPEVNDQAKVHYLRHVVSAVAGQFLPNVATARKWFTQKYKP